MKLFFAKTCMNVVRLFRELLYVLFFLLLLLQYPNYAQEFTNDKELIWLRHPTKNSEAI